MKLLDGDIYRANRKALHHFRYLWSFLVSLSSRVCLGQGVERNGGKGEDEDVI